MISDATIRKLPIGRKAVGGGLVIQTTASGSRLWRFRYQWHGRDRVLGLGRWPEVSVDDARQRMFEARQSLAAGRDPRRRASDKFGDVLGEYLAKARADGRAEGTVRRLERFERYLSPLASRPLASIEAGDVLAICKKLPPHTAHRLPPHTAHRLHGASKVFALGVATGRCRYDPAALLGHALPKASSEPRAALTDPARVGVLLRAIDAYGGSARTRRAMLLLALTAVRPSEVRGISDPAEFDLEAATWSHPGGSHEDAPRPSGAVVAAGAGHPEKRTAV